MSRTSTVLFHVRPLLLRNQDLPILTPLPCRDVFVPTQWLVATVHSPRNSTHICIQVYAHIFTDIAPSACVCAEVGCPLGQDNAVVECHLENVDCVRVVLGYTPSAIDNHRLRVDPPHDDYLRLGCALGGIRTHTHGRYHIGSACAAF